MLFHCTAWFIPSSWIMIVPNILGSIAPETIIDQQGFSTLLAFTDAAAPLSADLALSSSPASYFNHMAKNLRYLPKKSTCSAG